MRGLIKSLIIFIIGATLLLGAIESHAELTKEEKEAVSVLFSISGVRYVSVSYYPGHKEPWAVNVKGCVIDNDIKYMKTGDNLSRVIEDALRTFRKLNKVRQ